jgi:integrase
MASTRERNGRFIGLYRDHGKQKSAGTYATEEEALARAIVAERDAHPRETEMIYPEQKRGRITVAGYFPGWLRDHRLEETSRESYASEGKHVVKHLGAVPVADLDTARCRKFFRALEASGLSSATVGHIRTTLRMMCRAAVEDGILTRVPEMEIGHIRNKEMTIATRQEAAAIREAIAKPYKLLVETLFATGMRYAEAMGLGPEHVEIHDTYAVLKVGRRVIVQLAAKPVVRNYGKTSNAVRDVVIPRELGERLIMNARDGYVFRSARGGYLYRANFQRVWRPACVAAGVPTLRVHDTRHSHASWLANDPSVPLAAVRDRLGHSSLATTSRYVHSTTPPDAILAALGRAA